MAIEIKPLTETIGAEVIEIDLSDTIDDATFSRIQNTFHECGVLLFRDQHLSNEQHIAFSQRFGDLEIHIAKQYLLKDHPEIVVLSNKVENGKALGIEDAGRFWHSDLSYLPKPSLGSLLYAHEVPPVSAGGSTPFAGMYAAYDALDESLKEHIQDLTAIHSYEQRWQKDAERGMQRSQLKQDEREKLPEVSHPIVRAHPITGRKALYVNEGFTVRVEGMNESESQKLLNELFLHSTDPKFVYTHDWQANDLLMWDNACVIHSASWYDSSYIRHLHRTTIAGTVIN